MKKRGSLFLCLLTAALLAAGCGRGKAGEPQEAKQPEQREEQEDVSGRESLEKTEIGEAEEAKLSIRIFLGDVKWVFLV